MAISSQGTTFTFPGFTAVYTSISVEEPQAEIADVTGLASSARQRRLVATGDITQPGRVRVDYIRQGSTPAPLGISGMSGLLTISHENVSVSKKAIIESASSEMAVGQFLRGSLNFVIDDTP